MCRIGTGPAHSSPVPGSDECVMADVSEDRSVKCAECLASTSLGNDFCPQCHGSVVQRQGRVVCVLGIFIVVGIVILLGSYDRHSKPQGAAMTLPTTPTCLLQPVSSISNKLFGRWECDRGGSCASWIRTG